ncbi:MAG: hypothetical protein AAFZ15_15365 [Bacteroidota bacterium]
MKKLFTLLTLFTLSQMTSAQLSPVLVIQPLEFDKALISRSEIPDQVYDALTAALTRCGGYEVRYNHHWLCQDCTFPEIGTLEREINEILLALYIYRNGKHKDVKKLEEFKKKITTRVVVLGKLKRKSHSLNEYELVLYFVDLNTSNLVIPILSLSFTAYEVEDFEAIERKLLKELADEDFCEAVPTSPSPLTKEKLLEALRLLVRLEICFPQDQEIQKEVRNVKADDKTNLLYLDQKALAYTERLEKMLRDKNSTQDMLLKTATVLRETYYELSQASEFCCPSDFERFVQMMQNIERLINSGL